MAGGRRQLDKESVAMVSKAPFFLLLLLLLVARAPAQARDAPVFLDLHTFELPGHSPIYKGHIPVHLNGGSPLCSTCENFASEAVTYLSEKQTQDKILEFLHDACSQSFSLEHKCVELMDSYATLLFSKIAEIKPEEFCKQYGLCRDTALFSGVRSDSTCVFCHHLLDEIMSKLKDPDAEFEIIQILIKECNKIEGHVQQVRNSVLISYDPSMCKLFLKIAEITRSCFLLLHLMYMNCCQCKRLVLQYIPLILVNGEKFLEKNDVCALVQACPASQKTTVRSFLDERLVNDA
ncbi:hypothetical protein BAE44_0015216 [Dichanthelium oligosanthes]|uniref:Saposin B-type domain-containing protein n=1 Tax=Dichanthelium oligosanthes TaxID=888268 RepID=A0A1E5VFF0_9POAL|nr:hypothetical protein BAE44_0015216 [Dichanthelium oligosanthes]